MIATPRHGLLRCVSGRLSRTAPAQRPGGSCCSRDARRSRREVMPRGDAAGLPCVTPHGWSAHAVARRAGRVRGSAVWAAARRLAARAGVPVQLRAERRREDAHDAGRARAGRAGHHPALCLQGAPRPAVPRSAEPQHAFAHPLRCNAAGPQHLFPLHACAIGGLQSSGPRKLGMHVCRVRAAGELPPPVHPCPGVQVNS